MKKCQDIYYFSSFIHVTTKTLRNPFRNYPFFVLRKNERIQNTSKLAMQLKVSLFDLIVSMFVKLLSNGYMFFLFYLHVFSSPDYYY